MRHILKALIKRKYVDLSISSCKMKPPHIKSAGHQTRKAKMKNELLNTLIYRSFYSALASTASTVCRVSFPGIFGRIGRVSTT